jgi:BirA family biotin operon repressor/biotin-[acetyl-CoA-carboxylase] ligase
VAPGDAPVLFLDEIDSTNLEARRRAEAGERGPLWITAARQTAGRGRRGRRWEGGEGNLAATYLGSTSRSAAEAASISFVAALAAYDLVAQFARPAALAIKWPNDLLLEGRKVCGILVESGAIAQGGLWLAVGVGVNLAVAPDEAIALATVINTPPPAPDTALQHLSRAFDLWLARWDGEGFGPIRTAWIARAHGLGQPCVARLAHETFEGVAEDLEADGALRLRLTDGSARRVTAGDVFF